MKYIWPVLLVLLRALYFCYSVWCLAFPVVAIWFLFTLGSQSTVLGLDTGVWAKLLLAAFLVFAAIVVTLVYARRSKTDPNPFQSAFLSWFGTLRNFWNGQPGDMVKLHLPSGYMVENPPAYRIRGTDIQQVLQHIQPGDILLRAYEGYLDGFMIRHASVCSAKGFQPGWYTHAAVYLGEITDADRQHVPEHFRHDKSYFQEGKNMLVHAMAKGVHTQDLLTFCRCDYLTVLRIQPKDGQVDVPAAIENARRSALSKIGDSYDFDASDTTRFHRFSCSELAYYCLHSIRDALDLKPRPHALYPLAPLNRKLAVLKRTTIVPDDFYDLVHQGSMACVWEDAHSASQHGRKRARKAPQAAAAKGAA